MFQRLRSQKVARINMPLIDVGYGLDSKPLAEAIRDSHSNIGNTLPRHGLRRKLEDT